MKCECHHRRHLLGDECECSNMGDYGVDLGYGREAFVCEGCRDECGPGRDAQA